MSVTQAERDKARKAGNSLPDGSYPINNVAQLHAAAVLAASHHGDWKAAMTLIRRRARELGVDVTTLPGFGGDNDADDRSSRQAFELRKRRRASMIRQAERRGMLLEVRAKPDGTGGTEFVFEGYASVFDTPFPMWDRWGDQYTEIVKPGAFTRSLRRPDLDVPFLIGHDDKRLALARTKNGTLQLSQDSHGMLARAVMDGRRSDVRDLAYAVERGDQDEMSVGFVTLGQEWSDDYETRSMLDLDIHRGDVSSVPLAALPATAGSTMTFPAEILAARHGERRGNPVDQDLGDAADYNPQTLTAAHAFTGTHSHPHTDGSGGMHDHEHDHAGDASHDHGHDFGGDALVRINDAGVPAMEEEHGAAASLALRRRRLEILRLGGRGEVC